MAWTPGILLDYAMAMRALQDPPASGLLALARLPLRAWRRPLIAVTLAAVIAAAAMFGVTYGLSAPLIALDLAARGFGEVAIGLNAAMHAVGVLLVVPVLPRLAARFGQRTVIVAALLASAGLLAVFPLVALTLLWFPLRAALGAASELLFTLTETWANELSPEAARGRVMATYTAALSLGFAAGPAILAAVGSGDRAYLAGAALALAAILPLLWPTPPRARAGRGAADDAAALSAAGAAGDRGDLAQCRGRDVGPVLHHALRHQDGLERDRRHAPDHDADGGRHRPAAADRLACRPAP